MMSILQNVLPIFIILAVISLVIWRLPKVEITHTKAFEARRRINWITLGLSYAFLYFGRYNLSIAKTGLEKMGLLDNQIFGNLISIGAVVYGCSIVINAPLCDKFGGRKTLMVASLGASIANLLMGLCVVFHEQIPVNLSVSLGVLYAINMYFQSFGAVSIVKVNSAWFHVRERGMIGGIFGTLIALGFYFGLDWNRLILENFGVNYCFLIPAAVLFIMFCLDILIIRDSPKAAGFEELNTGDATSEDKGPRMPVIQVFKKLLTNPIIVTIAFIELCSGYIRESIIQWGPTVATSLPLQSESFIFKNWGMVNCCAGILSGIIAGIISDHVFKSRRGPVAAILYSGLLVFCTILFFVLDNFLFGVTFVCMVLCIVGVHGMLSGTASMDFGGSKNAGIATGLIDGFVYIGGAISGQVMGHYLPSGAEAAIPQNWITWPTCLMPAIVVGLILSIRIWNATVQNSKKSAPPKDPEPAEEEDLEEEAQEEEQIKEEDQTEETDQTEGSNPEPAGA